MIGANNTVSVRKLTQTGSKEFYEATPSITGLEAYIEQTQPELAPMFNAKSAYSLHRIFIDCVRLADGSISPSIEPKDRIVDAQGNEYAVEGVQPFKNNEIPDHLEIIVNLKEK